MNTKVLLNIENDENIKQKNENINTELTCNVEASVSTLEDTKFIPGLFLEDDDVQWPLLSESDDIL